MANDAPIKIGIAGLGVGAMNMLPELHAWKRPIQEPPSRTGCETKA